jgi:hypothetical protein
MDCSKLEAEQISYTNSAGCELNISKITKQTSLNNLHLLYRLSYSLRLHKSMSDDM